MKKILLIILVLISVHGLHSCISKSNIDIELPLQQKEIIVESYLTPGFRAELTLYESNTLEDELILVTLSNAKASIITNWGNIPLKDTAYRDSNRQTYVNYSSKDTVKNNSSYFVLDITTREGVKIQAATGSVSQVRMQHINVNENEISVQHNIDNTGEKYFKLVASTFKDGKHIETKYELYQQSNGLTGACTLPWKDLKAEADSVVVTLFHIQKDYYDYKRSVRYANSAYKDPFLTPEVIKSNIKGGVGIFTYYTFDKRGISL